MRIITGKARGIRLVTLDGLETRPTGGKVKEAVFSAIQFEIEGRQVLDLFAGSGQMGIEALSRGAAGATFVDKNAQAVQIVKQNLNHAKLFAQAKVLTSDYEEFLKRSDSIYDIVFVDPPYSKGLAEKALSLLGRLVSQNGVIIAETAKIDPMPDISGRFAVERQKDYSKTSIRIYRNKEV